jgi:hypothetical protein
MSYFPAANDWAVMYNNYTGAGTYLSVINPTGGLLQMTSNVSPSAYWQVFPLNGVNYVRNKAAGASLQLDVIISNQVYMPSLQRTDASAKGQQWSFISDIASGIEFWNLESAAAGSSVQLDTYSDTLQPVFEIGGHSGQMWSFSQVGKINDVAFSTVAGVRSLHICISHKIDVLIILVHWVGSSNSFRNEFCSPNCRFTGRHWRLSFEHCFICKDNRIFQNEPPFSHPTGLFSHLRRADIYVFFNSWW